MNIELYPAFMKDGEVTHADGWNSVSTICMSISEFEKLFKTLNIPLDHTSDYTGKIPVTVIRDKLKKSENTEYHGQLYMLCDVADTLEAFYIAYLS